MKLRKEITEKNASYMQRKIRHIIETFEKRPAGSKGEKDAQEYLADELKKYVDEVKIEDFNVRPDSFTDWRYITIISLLIALPLYFFFPAIALSLAIFAFLPMISQLLLFSKLFDIFFPKKKSCNVYGTKAPTGETKRRIIFAGHTDAAFEWFWHYKFGFKALILISILAIIGGIALIVLSLAAVILGNVLNSVDGILFWFGVGITPFSIFWFLMIRFYTTMVVDGANDNLSAVLVSMAVAKTMQENGLSLKNTEIGILFTGSEEAGLRGSSKFAIKHEKELKEIPTAIINLETLRDIKHLGILNRDMNMLIKNDKDVARLIQKAGKNLGYEIPLDIVEIGATDASSFTKRGIKANTLAAMSHELESYYHTRHDTFDNIDPEVLKNVLEICIVAANIFDEKGFNF